MKIALANNVDIERLVAFEKEIETLQGMVKLQLAYIEDLKKNPFMGHFLSGFLRKTAEAEGELLMIQLQIQAMYRVILNKGGQEGGVN